MATEADYRAQQAGTAPKNTGTASSAAFQTNVQNFAAPVAQTMAVQPPKAPAFPLKVAGQAFNIGKAATKAAGSFVKNSAVDVWQQGRGAADALNPQDSFARQHEITKQRLTLDRKQSQIVADYKAGRMTKDNYSKSLKSLGAGYSGLSKDATKLVKESDPTKMASDVVWTAINALTLGTGLIVKQGGKTAAEVAVKEGLFNGGVKAVENLITKVPGARELVERNAAKVTTREAQKLAGESTEAYLARTGKAVVVGLLIKRPIFYQTNVGLAQDTYKHILDGQYDEATKSAAWIGAQMIGGGPIGWFMNQGKRGLSHVGSLARGKESFIDEVSRRIGNGNPNQLADIAGKDPAAERTLRILQETNLQSADGRVSTAVDNLLTHYTEHGIALDSLTGEQIVKDMTNWATADELAQKTIRMGVIKGVSPESVGRYAVVRWDSSTKNALAGAIEATDGSPQAIADAVFALSERPGVGWGNNDILMKRVTDIISSGGSKEAIAADIKAISTASTVLDGVPSKVRKQLADLGYTIAAPFGGNKIARVNYDDVENSTRKLITSAVKGDTALFDVAHAPEPVLSGISTLLGKAGLSPEAANTVAHRALSEHLVGNLGELGIARNLGLHGEGDMITGGRAMLSELQRYVENKKGAFLVNKISSGKSAVTDIRQLTHDEISTALGISKSEAKDVSRAVRMAYTQVPLELRGLGDKIVDYAIAAPLSPMRYYLRVQSALRYTYNPFFRTQEQVETNLLASMDANKFIWAHSGLDESVTTLEKNGYFSGNVFGSGADDNVIGRISANLTQFQKRNLAGLGETIAKSQGKTLEQVILDTPEQLDDALRVIVQYGKHGALSSPLARTINIAFFPMRYNVKVSMLVADKLASLPPSLQFATLQGIHKTRDWLKSDEGLQWQADNAEAIKVFAWASPVGNITQFAKILSGSTDSIGDWGLLGGLPFGVISQLLDAEGIINLNKPYVNPSTGDVLPDYIPQSTKAQAAVALQSLLGSMFSFPGRTLGLPGKEKGVRDAVGLFINTNGTDFDKRVNTDQLTPLQQQMIRVLKGDTSDAAVKAMYYAPAPGQFDYYTLPPSSLPYTVKATNDPLPNPTLRRGLPSNKKAKAGPKVKPLPVPITRP